MKATCSQAPTINNFSWEKKKSQHAGSGSPRFCSFSSAMTFSARCWGILNCTYNPFSYIFNPQRHQDLLHRYHSNPLRSPKCRSYSTSCHCWQHSLPPSLLQPKHSKLEVPLNAVNTPAFPQGLSPSPPTNGVPHPEQARNARRSTA